MQCTSQITNKVSSPCACAGSYTHQAAAGTEWEGVTIEQWQAYALQQGWDLGYLQQQAYYQQYGAWGTDAAATAYTQVSSGDSDLLPASSHDQVLLAESVLKVCIQFAQ
jgi:hypothetical protein